MKVTLNQNVLTDNELAAAYNREQFQKRKILAVNMMSSPGAGKTTLLEKNGGPLFSRISDRRD